MFQRINTDELNGRQKEIYNFQKSAALLADYGFNCIKLADDWNGADWPTTSTVRPHSRSS